MSEPEERFVLPDLVRRRERWKREGSSGEGSCERLRAAGCGDSLGLGSEKVFGPGVLSVLTPVTKGEFSRGSRRVLGEERTLRCTGDV